MEVTAHHDSSMQRNSEVTAVVALLGGVAMVGAILLHPEGKSDRWN